MAGIAARVMAGAGYSRRGVNTEVTNKVRAQNPFRAPVRTPSANPPPSRITSNKGGTKEVRGLLRTLQGTLGGMQPGQGKVRELQDTLKGQLMSPAKGYQGSRLQIKTDNKAARRASQLKRWNQGPRRT